MFLMYRVELKATYSHNSKTFCGIEFLMYRVELKDGPARELKAEGTNSVPNVPCGVEREVSLQGEELPLFCS